jgi:tRNA nucleotidyltransferase (CCA-adding enzyme)
MEETDFVRGVSNIGGRAYVVGGWVRDREMGVPGRDKDYAVAGVTESAFKELFPGAIKVGGRFPVYRLEIASETRDVSLARRETKSGLGYRGFEALSSPLVTIEEDLLRRDSTINAMAIDLETGELIDPSGGMRDLESGIIRAVSRRFADDPVRALRAARQAAQLDFQIDAATLCLMTRCGDELAGEPRERLVNELKLALSCRAPSLFFASLDAAGILDVTYPAVHALTRANAGAFSRAMSALDRAAALTTRAEIRFAALAVSAGLELSAGEAFWNKWNLSDAGIPKLWAKCALFAASWCGLVFEIRDPDAIRNLFEGMSRHPIGPDGFGAVILSVYGETPPVLKRMDELESAIRRVNVRGAPKELSGERLGAWLRNSRNAAIAEIMNGRIRDIL